MGKESNEINRNPISIALGAYLSSERQRILPDSSSDKVAKKIKIKESLYRMIESGNARIHPKYTLKLLDVFEDSKIDYAAFCRLLIAIQFLDCHLSTPSEFCKALAQIDKKDKGHAKLINDMRPLIDAVLKGESGLKEIFQSGKIIDSIREFLSNAEFVGRETSEVQQERISEIFKNIPTIYYSFIDNTILELLTLPLGFRSGDLWKWEKNNRLEFKYLYAVVKEVESIISEDNFSRYKYEYLWSPNFIEAHIIILGKHNEKKLHADFTRILKKVLKEDGDLHLLEDIEQRLSNLHIHSVELSKSKSDEIFVDTDANDPDRETEYDLAWVFQMKSKAMVGLKAKVVQDNWKLQEGISLTWDKTSALYSKIKPIIEK